jgi:acyl dehydratase
MIRPTKTPQDVSIGDKLPVLKHTFTLVDLVLYGAATWDWNRMHYDVEHAHHLNLPGPVIDGQEFGAFLARAALEWAGPRAFLTRLALRMKTMAFAGDTLCAEGEVKEMRDGLVVLTQHLTCVGGRLVAEATTELRLP